MAVSQDETYHNPADNKDYVAAGGWQTYHPDGGVKPAVLLVQFTCVPGKCPATIAYQGEPPQQLLQAYHDKLGQLQPLRCSGEVSFQFTLKVRP